MTTIVPATSHPVISLTTVMLCVAGALLYLWFGWCVFPSFDWNEVRLSPAFALRHGYPVYPLETDGPLSTWIYGPVGILLNLPATFADSAVTALQTAAGINALILVLPIAVLCVTAENFTPRARVIAFAFATLLLPASALSFYVADHAAVGFGLLSCWCLVRSKGHKLASTNIACAALCCGLSVSSKQTGIFLPLAQLAFLWREREFATIRRYSCWLAATFVTMGLGFGAAFGFQNLWLNLVHIPGRLPWGDISGKIVMRLPQLLAYIFAPSAFLALRTRLRLAGEYDTENERFVRCTSFAFIVMLPIGVLSFFKIGGDTNVFHSWFYIMPALVLSGVSRATDPGSANLRLLAILGGLLALRFPELSRLVPHSLTSDVEIAEQIAVSDRGSAWFPNNPIITFYSDHALYHVEDGIRTRHLAGMGLKEGQFRESLPNPIKAVVYAITVQHPLSLQLLPEFSRRRVIGPWVIYSREPVRP